MLGLRVLSGHVPTMKQSTVGRGNGTLVSIAAAALIRFFTHSSQYTPQPASPAGTTHCDALAHRHARHAVATLLTSTQTLFASVPLVYLCAANTWHTSGTDQPYSGTAPHLTELISPLLSSGILHTVRSQLATQILLFYTTYMAAHLAQHLGCTRRCTTCCQYVDWYYSSTWPPETLTAAVATACLLCTLLPAACCLLPADS
jgi:hypothetical protein